MSSPFMQEDDDDCRTVVAEVGTFREASMRAYGLSDVLHCDAWVARGSEGEWLVLLSWEDKFEYDKWWGSLEDDEALEKIEFDLGLGQDTWEGDPDYDETSYGWNAWFNGSQS